MKTIFRFLPFFFAGSMMLMASCSKSSNGSLASFQPQINNAPDNFQLQATGVSNVTNTFDYNWTNSGTMATIDKSGVVTAGSAHVLIYDKNGTNVYASSLAVTGSDSTIAGISGTWRIRLVLSGYSGTLNFRVQKK